MLDALSNCILKIEHDVKTARRPEDCVIGETFLATLASIRAAGERRDYGLQVLKTFERLVGHSFLTGSDRLRKPHP